MGAIIELLVFLMLIVGLFVLICAIFYFRSGTMYFNKCIKKMEDESDEQ